MNLQSLKGRSLPSRKHGAWIVDSISHDISGRSRLVTANLKGEQWIWTSSLVEMFANVDSLDERNRVDALAENYRE